MPVEELDVVVDVLVEIAASDERPANRLEGVDPESEAEQEKRTEGPVGEDLKPAEGACEPLSDLRYGFLTAMLDSAGLRRR
jgi:hypothetical protein